MSAREQILADIAALPDEKLGEIQALVRALSADYLSMLLKGVVDDAEPFKTSPAVGVLGGNICCCCGI